jgi:glucose/arabinose dehydrogenase
MHYLIRLACLPAILLATDICRAELPVNGLTDAEQRSGWELAFDGKTTDGWRNYKQDDIGDGWVVKDGTLSRVSKGAGDIITKKKYKFFEISLEYNISKGGNSGLMFHVAETEARPWQTGPEVQIQDNVDGHDAQKAGWLYQMYKPLKPAWAKNFEKLAGISTPDETDATRPAGQWNNLYLRISPTQCEVAMNGVSYYKFTLGDDSWNKLVAASKFAKYENFGKAGEGHICLQDHGNLVSFRNIKIRELSDEGLPPEPTDEKLALKGRLAYPHLQWEGFDGVDAQGKIRELRPMEMTHGNDGSGRVFVATQRGVIHVFKNDPSVKKTKIFLDLTEKVRDWKNPGANEEGLLGLAFHPDYKTNGEFFVYYTAEEGPKKSIVSRFRVSKEDANRADPESEEVLMKINQPFANHNGGSILFGKDGYLYIGLGDGGGRNDPFANGQNLGEWMGSVLRIDIDKKQGDKNYSIPSDNPFVNRKGAKPEIFAYGFRNTWRMSADPKTGAIWISDVGQDLWEEIDILKRGGNYGWSSRESTHAFGNIDASKADTLVEPIWEYDHQIGKSITGGCVYRSSRLPELAGAYLYADYVTGRVWALQYDVDAGKVVKNSSIASSGIPVVAFGQDAQGEVYYMIGSVQGKSIFRFERSE